MLTEQLELKPEMDRTRLIQRLLKPTGRINPYSFGAVQNGGLSDEAAERLKDVFSFDYMGAAEFEYGAVPAAISFIDEEAKKSRVLSSQHQGVYYICPTSYEQGVQKVIGALLTDERSLRLLEYCGLKDSMDSVGHGNPRQVVGWLELNNGFFMFSEPKMFEDTKRLFGVS